MSPITRFVGRAHALMMSGDGKKAIADVVLPLPTFNANG